MMYFRLRVLLVLALLNARCTRRETPAEAYTDGRLKDWVPNQRIEMTKNPHYRDAAHNGLNGIVCLSVSLCLGG